MTALDSRPATSWGVAAPAQVGPAQVEPAQRDPARRDARERRVLVGGLAALYLTVGCLLVLRYGSLAGDALSRVANAVYVVESRDPHLAAIGFVWNPLPSLLAVPFVPLGRWWAPLVSHGLIGVALTSVAMALAVGEFHRLLGVLGWGGRSRRTATLLLGLNPMIVFYGANGLSDAYLVLFLLWASRCLLVWWRDGSLGALAGCGAALGLAYLARYEAVAAGAATMAAVAVLSAWRSAGPMRRRVLSGGLDALLVGTPLVVAFTAWAVISWLVVGSPFETVTSLYGNTQQVADNAQFIRQATGESPAQRLAYVGAQVLWLAPLLPALLVGALVAARRRSWALAPAVVLGGALAFQTVAFVAGSTFGWLRFSLSALPLMACLAAVLASCVRDGRARGLARVGCCAALALAAGTSGWVMGDDRLAREESAALAAVVSWDTASPGQRDTLLRFTREREIAAHLDGLELPPGSVLTDTGAAFAVVAASRDTRQFVITSDDDFEAALADPAVHGVRYVLVSDSLLDAVRREHPDAVDGRYPGAVLDRRYSPLGGPTSFWLYRVTAAP